MAVKAPVRKGLKDVRRQDWLPLSLRLGRVVADDTCDDYRSFSLAEKVVRLAEENFGRGCAVRKV